MPLVKPLDSRLRPELVAVWNSPPETQGRPLGTDPGRLLLDKTRRIIMTKAWWMLAVMAMAAVA
jgi:hypothetical protein